MNIITKILPLALLIVGYGKIMKKAIQIESFTSPTSNTNFTSPTS